jgi:hypothetical protein
MHVGVAVHARSFDAGYGSSHMARIVGQKKAREIWFLCRFYSAQEALQMGVGGWVGGWLWVHQALPRVVRGTGCARRWLPQESFFRPLH